MTTYTDLFVANGTAQQETTMRANDAARTSALNAAIGGSGSLTTTGTITAGILLGDGSGITGLTGATGGISNTGATTIASDSNDSGVGDIALQTTSTTRMTVKSTTGNIGIGTASPGNKLFVRASGSPVSTGALSGLFISSTDGTVGDGLGIGSSGAATYKWIQSYSGSLALNPEGGNVGIGTATPGANLHAYGTAGETRIFGISDAALDTSDPWQASFQIKTAPTGNNWVMSTVGYAVASKGVRFYNGGGAGYTAFEVVQTSGTRLIVDGVGNVGIGTATPSYQLELSTDSAGKPSTNTWTIVSDIRTKENIELADLDRCYEIVKSVPLKRFGYRTNCYTGDQIKDRNKIGWVADDVIKQFPKAVGTSQFKKVPDGHNEDVISDKLVLIDELNVKIEGEEDPSILDGYNNEKEILQSEILVLEKDEIEIIVDCKNLNNDQMYASMYGALQKSIEKIETLETTVATQATTITDMTDRIGALEDA